MTNLHSHWPTILDLFSKGEYFRASTLAQSILLEDPKHHPSLHMLGVIYQISGQHEQALAYLDSALKIDSGNAQIWSNRASALRSLRHFEPALQSIEEALKLQPQLTGALLNQGNILYDLGFYERALDSYDTAIALDQADFKAHSGRARSLQQLEYFEEALIAYCNALNLNPRDADLWVNQGIVLIALNQASESLTAFDRALDIDPLHVKAKHNKSIALLKLGEFEKAWPLYESRFEVQNNVVRRFSEIAPLTKIGQLPGSKVLIWCEQGFGDTFQFIRYLDLIEQMGGQPVLVPQTGMEELIRSSFPRCQLLKAFDNLASFQYQSPLMSLPLIFNTTVESIPARVPYLWAEESAIDQWRQQLGVRERFRIGLVWSGRASHPNDHHRSLALEHLLRYIPAHYECIALQNQLSEPDQLTIKLSNRMTEFSKALVDFSQTAALIMNMDLVISVDTSVTHLAGALGVPVWILLPHVADWRWMQSGTTTPWYPTARLYRQNQPKEWVGVLDQIKIDLLKINS